MAYDGNHVLVAWGGTMPGGEIWSNTVRMRDVNPIGFPDHAAINGYLVGGFKTALATFWTALGGYVGPNTKLVWMKANAVGTNGKYLDDTTNVYTWTTPAGGLLSADRPNQLSIAVTTTTGASRGRAHAGRFFLPASVAAINATTGLFTTGEADGIAGPAATFLSALNSTASVLGVQQLRCAVMSNIGAGTHHDITGVRVGRVVDTQRRRRNKPSELGQTAAVTP